MFTILFFKRTSDKKTYYYASKTPAKTFFKNSINLPKYSNLSNLTLPIRDIIDGMTI